MKRCIICNCWENYGSLYICDRCMGDSRKIDTYIMNFKFLLQKISNEVEHEGAVKNCTHEELKIFLKNMGEGE